MVLARVAELMMQSVSIGHLVLDGFRILCRSGLVPGCRIGCFRYLVCLSLDALNAVLTHLAKKWVSLATLVSSSLVPTSV